MAFELVICAGFLAAFGALYALLSWQARSSARAMQTVVAAFEWAMDAWEQQEADNARDVVGSYVRDGVEYVVMRKSAPSAPRPMPSALREAMVKYGIS